MSIGSFFSGIAERFRGGKKSSKEERVSNTVVTHSLAVGGRTQRPEADQRTLYDEGYRRNVILHAGVNIIANTVSQPKVYAKDSNSDKPLPDTHPLNELLWMPDRGVASKNQLLREAVISLKTTGNAYIHKGRNARGVPVRLRNLRADRIEVMPSKETGEIEAFEYKTDGMSRSQVIPRADIIHIKLFDPLNDYYGLSPMVVAARFANLDSEAALYMRDFFMNGAMPAGLLKVRAKTTPEEREQAREQWKETYGKSTRGRDLSNWWNVGVIDQDVEFQAIGQGPAEMRLDGIWNITESRLCAAIGVPPILVQSKLGLERGTYSNYEQARKQFWQETLVPLYTHIAETLTAQLAYDFDDSAEIIFDMSEIDALQESSDSKASRVNTLFAGGVISRDEAREQTGHEKGEVDVIVLPQGAIDASMLKDKLAKKEEAAPPEAAAGETKDVTKNVTKNVTNDDDGEENRRLIPAARFEAFMKSRHRQRAGSKR